MPPELRPRLEDVVVDDVAFGVADRLGGEGGIAEANQMRMQMRCECGAIATAFCSA